MVRRTLQSRGWTPLLLASAALFVAGCGGFGTKAKSAKAPSRTPAAATPSSAAGADAGLDARLSDTSFDTDPSPAGLDFWDDAAETSDRERGRSGSEIALNLFGEMDGVAGSPRQFGATESIVQVSFAREGADFDPDIDQTGQLIVFASTQHSASADIYVKSIDGHTVTQLTDDPADDMMPEWSPDNKHVAFTSTRAGNWDIFVMESNGSTPVQITFDPAPEIHPSWSPDGRYLVFSKRGQASGRWELWVTDLGGTPTPRFLDYGLFPEWSPDPASNRIVYQKARERGSRYYGVWTIDFVDGEGQNKTEIASAANAAAINPSWSPDGSMICFATITNPGELRNNKPARADIWIVNVDGTNKVRLTNGEFANLNPTWGSDSRVYFVSDRAGVENIWALESNQPIATAQALGGDASTNEMAGVAADN
ncbi:MAG: TolB family protein [Phycisphaerales bacterium]